jgi:aryl-alcohol dehydrogenase-like predicted oxidoreductase
MDPFETRRLGRTTVTVPVLGLGTAPLGGWPTAVPAEQARSTVDRAWQAGIRYFDTAPFYGHGNSEANLGAVLRKHDRDQYVLGTKVGRILEPGPPGPTIFQGVPDLAPVFDYSPAGIQRSLADSRERLGIDRFDVVLLHDPDDHHAEAADTGYQVLAELRERGEIGAIGVGMNWSEPLAQFADEAELDCFLLAGRYTLFEQDSMDELLPKVVARGMSIIAGGVYNSGLLIDPSDGATYNYFPAPDDVLARARAIKDVCTARDVPLRAAALQFPLGHPAVATVVVGARTPSEVDDTLAMAAIEIPDDLWNDLKERGLLRADAPVPAAKKV